MADDVIAIEPQVHVRFDGRSLDIPLADLDVGTMSTDDQVRNAVATFLEVPAFKLQAFRVERNEQTGSITIRPEAVFGETYVD